MEKGYFRCRGYSVMFSILTYKSEGVEFDSMGKGKTMLLGHMKYSLY